jgi:integrase
LSGITRKLKHDPEFWRILRDVNTPVADREGTLSRLIAEYRASPLFLKLRPGSQRKYNRRLNLLDKSGDRSVATMSRRDIYELLDTMSSTPAAANMMLTVLRVALEFGVPRGYCDTNQAVGIKRLKLSGDGHKPWTEAQYELVMKNAPEHLRRMTFLGRATGQRVSDLVRVCPADLADDGISVTITKLRDKAHFVPLSALQLDEIRSWTVKGRSPFIATENGQAFTPGYLERTWLEWRETFGMARTIHGLRATAINDRRSAGTEDGAIADEIGMSVKMVTAYLRFADKTASARASRDRRERNKDGK